MGRPKTYRPRSKTLTDGRVSWYARFTDQHGQRQEPFIGYDLDPEGVERKLRDIQYEVEHQTWRPASAAVAKPAHNPTFHVHASDWREEQNNEEGAARTRENLDWALSHLLPYFAKRRMRDIDADAVDGYRKAKLKEKRLSATSINKTIEILARILEAGERYYPTGNPAAGRRRKAKVGKRDPVGNWLDYDHVLALLDAAHLLDTVPYAELVARYGEGVPKQRFLHQGRRAQLAALYLCAMRVTETCGLQRKHINWNRGVIRVTDEVSSVKTERGYRTTPMHRLAFDVMREWWLRQPDKRPDAPLFPHSRGGHRDKDNTRVNVLAPAVKMSAILLAERGQNPLPANSRTHDGRRTALNWWAEAGYEQADTMEWAGHATARLAIEVYRRARRRGIDQRVKDAMAEVPEAERGDLRALRPVA